MGEMEKKHGAVCETGSCQTAGCDGHGHGPAGAEEHGHGGCGCEEGTETLDRGILIRIGITALLVIVNILAGFPEPLTFAVYAGALLVIGYDVMAAAVRGLFQKLSLDEMLLMSVACIGAFAIGEYVEGILVMLLYQLGELFQGYAVGSSRKSIRSLVDLRPESVTVLRDGAEVQIPAAEARPGDRMVVKAGERIALDGKVLEGSSTLDTSALTGESLARLVEPGDGVLSGCINQSGLLTVAVTAPLEQSAVSRILEMVEEATENKAEPERLITRFAKVYTPIVFLAAVLIGVLPPLVFGLEAYPWIYRSLTFLVISCPCALVISVPLTYFAGIGGASKQGILFKSAGSLDALRGTSAVVFDKTGTLTTGQFHVARIQPEGMGENDLLTLAAYAESRSDHPLATSIVAAYGVPIDRARLTAYQEKRGKGVSAILDGDRVLLAGKRAYLEEQGVSCPDTVFDGTAVLVALDGRYAGYIGLEDTVKPGVADFLQKLRGLGAARQVLLTGDSRHAAEATAERVGLTEVYADCLPEDKAARLTEILSQETGQTVYVGDGINDAPVLAMADIGVAMGGLGADAAIEAADVVVMGDDPAKVHTAIVCARKTGRVVVQNIAFALLVKVLIMGVSLVGMIPMGLAIFADVGVSLLAVLNAMRALKA